MNKLEIGLAVAILAVMSFLLMPQVRSVVGDVVAGLKTLFKRLACLPMAQALSWCLRSSDKSDGSGGYKLYKWIGINSLFFIGLLFSPRNTLTLGVTVALLGLHLCIIAIALFVIKEETQWWDGLLAPEERVFRNITYIKDPAILSISTAFSILFICLSVLTWDAVEKYEIVLRAPRFHCGPAECKYVFYVISLVRELPSVSAFIHIIQQGLSYAKAIEHQLPGMEVLREQTWLGDIIIILGQKIGQYLSYSIAVGHQLPGVGFVVGKIWTSDVIFSEWPGLPVAWTIYTVTWLWVFGIYTVLWRQRQEIKQLLIAFQKTTDKKTRGILEERAARAPAGIQTALLLLAIDYHQDPLIQSSAIEIAPKAKMYTFPEKFVVSIQNQSRNIRHIGLEKIKEFLQDDGGAFEPARVSVTLDKLAGTSRGKLDTETLKLMDALVVEYAQLGLRKDVSALSKGKVKNRLLRIAISSKDSELRQRALEAFAESDAFGLCKSVIEAIDNEEICDIDRSKELLRTCAELISVHKEEWAEKDLNELSDKVSTVSSTRRRKRLRKRRFRHLFKRGSRKLNG